MQQKPFLSENGLSKTLNSFSFANNCWKVKTSVSSWNIAHEVTFSFYHKNLKTLVTTHTRSHTHTRIPVHKINKTYMILYYNLIRF